MSSILWLTWKDHQHPEAGGAEVVCRELTKRLLADGHKVTLLTCGYSGATALDMLDGVQVIRVGTTRHAHPFQALAHYVKQLRNTFDILIEEVNGAAPYFSVLFERKAQKFLFYHQLARKNWLYEIPTPIAELGYHMLVPAASRLASWSHTPVITVSESTRQVLARHGFPPERTHIISEGIEIKPATRLKSLAKHRQPTVLSLGSMRPMKRTLHQIKAFELAKTQLSNLQLHIAGSATTDYGAMVLRYIQQSPYARDITYLGKVSKKDKIKLMQKSHLILQTAIEEGWGLTITEAASQGTPAVAYNVDGLRDSIRHKQTGLITNETPEALADGIVTLLRNKSIYNRLREAAWRWSKQITFDRSYQDFKRILELG